MGGPEKGRWVFSPKKGCLLWSFVPTIPASPLTVPLSFHQHHTSTACRSYSALATNHGRVHRSLRTHRAREPNVVGYHCSCWHEHIMRPRSMSGCRRLARSRGRSGPVPCSPLFPCSVFHTHGSWGIRGRLGRLLWRCQGHHLVLRTCCCCGRWRRRRSLRHPRVPVPGGERGQLGLGHLDPPLLNSLLGNDYDSASHPGDDRKGVVQLLSHDPSCHSR
jgi:hypothetical protein